jgi:hypothetical protein
MNALRFASVLQDASSAGFLAKTSHHAARRAALTRCLSLSSPHLCAAPRPKKSTSATAKSRNTHTTHSSARTPPLRQNNKMATTLEVGLGTVEIDNADVVRLVLQYLREAGLTSAAAELEREADVRLNALTNKASLVEDVRKGRWEKALPRLNGLDLPRQASCDLWEHVVRELVHSREPKAAKSVLEGASPLLYLRETDPGRLDALKRLVSRAAEFERLGGQAYSAQDTVDAFPEDSRDVKRRKLSETIDDALGEVAPERLASLLGAALRWRAHTGRAEGGRVDIFRGTTKKAKLEAEKPPRRQAGALRLGEGSRPLCLCFSGDGTALITGSSDGFIEVWDPALCRLRQDLVYQARRGVLLLRPPLETSRLDGARPPRYTRRPRTSSCCTTPRSSRFKVRPTRPRWPRDVETAR